MHICRDISSRKSSRRPKSSELKDLDAYSVGYSLADLLNENDLFAKLFIAKNDKKSGTEWLNIDDGVFATAFRAGTKFKDSDGPCSPVSFISCAETKADLAVHLNVHIKVCKKREDDGVVLDFTSTDLSEELDEFLKKLSKEQIEKLEEMKLVRMKKPLQLATYLKFTI